MATWSKLVDLVWSNLSFLGILFTTILGVGVGVVEVVGVGW